jgi:hypothetical protein
MDADATGGEAGLAPGGDAGVAPASSPAAW